MGQKKRRDLSTSISSISAKEITASPVADAAQALQGRVSGVTIVQGSGAPGGTGGTGIKIRISS
jgi:outer membrane receptor for ferrienterochelin and colicin